MPVLSSASQARLDTCHSDLQVVFKEVIRHIDFVVIQGHRGEQEQHEAFASGRSRLPWPKGKHNSIPSLAIDVAPLPLDWNDRDHFHYFAGFVMGVAKLKGIPLRYGGDWNGDWLTRDNKFDDLVHYELMMPVSTRPVEVA